MPDLHLIKLCLEQFLAEHEIDPYSREFIFGNAERFARLRNQPIFRGPNGPVTVLSAMLRYGLDDTRRANLFFSPHHLGSPKQIPQAQLTLVDLAKKVRKEKQNKQDEKDKKRKVANPTPGNHISNKPEVLKKDFESITDALKEITGTTIGKYEDKQNTLRVIYLLDRMMPHSGFAEERSIRLLTFIRSLARGFSFEARDAYPITESEGNTFLLNDLKAYIGIEIANETTDKIDSVFYSLINRVNDIRLHLDEVAYSSANRLQIYRSIHSVVGAIDDPSWPDPHRRPTRLDEDLYLHLNRFEFLHFAGAHAEILNTARPPSPVASIQDGIIEAQSTLAGAARDYYDTTLDDFPLDDFIGFANKNADLFVGLIGKALGFRPSQAKYERSVSLAYELLYRTRVFGSDLPLFRDSVKISFRNMVSALCATAQALKFVTHYRPRVSRDNTQARSIITPLESPIEFDDKSPPREIPEGYLQIWHNRREWVQDALEGTYEIAELKFSLRSLLWAKFVECVQPNDIAVIEKNLSALETRLLGVRPDGLGT